MVKVQSADRQPNAWQSLRQEAWRVLLELCAAPGRFAAVVLALALAWLLPLLLTSLLINVQNFAGQWPQQHSLSLFLKPGVNDVQLQRLRTELSQRSEVKSLEWIKPEQARAQLAEFAALPLELLSLPLPHVLVLHAQHDVDLQVLDHEFSQHVLVEQSVYDQRWQQRLALLLDVLAQWTWGFVLLVVVLSLLLLLVLLKLLQLQQRAYWQVARLLGASETQLQRPLLLRAYWYALLAMLLSLLLASLLNATGGQAIEGLLALYGANISWAFLPFLWCLLLLLLAPPLLAYLALRLSTLLRQF